ncbi:MAG: potassium transporter TrkA [Chloroflexi bacterium AL-W]|nr:potassium transporter TrkA [Chloroflexi bacterium AL-N1]NOK68113.1 potassium transporter TrkA [Chloroflexi bacterium AL-N10]NOK73453.1 potassium transporter TrkA [Chloroflexi bacterium AL-N5]NOK83367.1 potassium transporter TrkA [Chloroflexi bacterium AL-W]NOK87784.1 potassium transporter TrkA [Chloroflexi bacterium AL-N15]
MLAIISLLLVITISIVITRIATIALTHTGLSKESARFQARSAFTGAGFTTNESESVVNHPIRRRIVLLLMLLGNAGIVTAVSSLILTFVNQSGPQSTFLNIVVLIEVSPRCGD